MKVLFAALFAMGWIALVASGDASAQKDAPKAEATGTLTMGDKTYKLTRALAYETTRFKKKQTIVILSEKALDTAKLKQSLAKKGTDEDFFPFDAHVKLYFDEKGALSQTAIYADGANIIEGGNDNFKATVTIKDGTVKGKAGMEKADTFFKKSFQYEVAFDVAVLQAALASPVPAPPIIKAEPKAPLVPKKKAKTKTAPTDPSQPALVTEKVLEFDGLITQESPKVMSKPAQIHAVKMSPDKTYLIDMESKDFDAYLRVLDSNNKSLASDDDSGGNHNARIRFTPPREGTYQVVATRFGNGVGKYAIKIRVLRAGEGKQP